VPTGNIADLVNELRLDILATNPRARLLQGLFNLTFFIQAMLSGIFTDIIERLKAVTV
jgi:hypothetical protein